MIADINEQFIFFALQKLIVIINVFINSYQCAIISEMALNISLHGSDCNKLQRHFHP